MKKVKFILLVLVSTIIVSCGTTSTVPLTGRKQTLMVSDGEVLSLASEQYQEFMKSAKKSTNATNTAMVQRVGQKLASAVNNYLNNNGLSAEVKNFSWEFNLVQDNQVNAWCMPGGKIVVYEGLLPVTQNEASLAIVLGHEIAHAVAKHSAEQLSTQMKQQYGVQIGSVVAGALGMGQNTQSIVQAVVSMRARPTTWDSSLPPWLATTRRWPSRSGSAWPPRQRTRRPSSLATTPAMPSASSRFRVGCPRR